MPSSEELVVKLSKKKIVFLIFISVGFVAVGSWLTTLTDSLGFEHWLLIFATTFFAVCGTYATVKAFDKKSGLILSQAGFTDNSSGVAAGFVPWSEVTGVHIMQIQRQKFLVVAVTDPHKYINRGNAFRRLINYANKRYSGSPITISSVALQLNFDQLVRLFNSYLTRYHANDR